MTVEANDLTGLTVHQAVARQREGRIRATELVQASLDRIDAQDARLGAWVTLDRAGALAAAGERDRETQRGLLKPLHGVPIGVKDIYLTRRLPTAAGFPPLADYQPGLDAAVVERLEQAGAIILGKTVTTQFASVDPAKTTNPWDAERTPGGSSSGSAAAVATRMVPAAIGSQTVGSVLRPAAYCGVFGMKPTFGRISLRGVFPLSWSLDHAGFMARSVEDLGLLLSILAGHDPADPGSARVPVDDYLRASARPAENIRLGILANWQAQAQPTAWEHFRAVTGQLREAGATLRDLEFPGGLPYAIAIQTAIMRVEVAASHADRFARQRDAYAPRLRGWIESGQLISGVDYVRAQQLRRQLRQQTLALFHDADCLIVPTASGPAPDRSTTGDASFQAPASLLGLPAVTIPTGLSADGLPLGLQIIAPPFAEAKLLSVARFVESVLPPIGAPPI
ncbi:MAG TPA: amidase [Chloroflexota bacterium]|nr:amidase [Chloroflexota bacterium]